MQTLRWQSYCNVIQPKSLFKTLSMLSLCLRLPIWGWERCKWRAVVFKQNRWRSYCRILSWCPLCYYLMKEAVVWCLVCCVWLPLFCAVGGEGAVVLQKGVSVCKPVGFWSNLRLMRGFRSCSVVALNAVEYCLFVLILRFRACLPAHHLHDLESSREQWGKTCSASDDAGLQTINESYSWGKWKAS